MRTSMSSDESSSRSRKKYRNEPGAQPTTGADAKCAPLSSRPLCDTKSLQEVSSEMRGPPVPPGESRGLNQERP